jgi:hypothetical protein
LPVFLVVIPEGDLLLPLLLRLPLPLPVFLVVIPEGDLLLPLLLRLPLLLPVFLVVIPGGDLLLPLLFFLPMTKHPCVAFPPRFRPESNVKPNSRSTPYKPRTSAWHMS